ncbi:DUF2169 family type VI secretion system accessory protein [Salinibius halmophilus]|uniref:DUF2169 family type VI secretion system accessory protein n=1 Tax=Salinibius halmophilus TaxID=1853216 RepID=UPI000E664F4B|nr:DUF2169 domain-containing protein [Salinibius halmophilus]
MQVNNHTDFTAAAFPGWSLTGQQVMTLVVKASYKWDDEGKLSVVPEPELVLADEYQEDDANQPVVKASEIAVSKQGFELLISGKAHPPGPAKGLIVQAALLDQEKTELWQKKLAVFGERKWVSGLMGRSISEPQLIKDPVPLSYALAYGGQYQDRKKRLIQFEQNPAGLGFNPDDEQLPAIEQKPLIKSRRDQRAPAGFGPIAPMWAPRQEAFAKLDSDAAQAGECPYPAGIEQDMFNCAPLDQRFTELPKTASYVRLQHMSADQPMMDIEFPSLQLTAAVQSISDAKPKPLNLQCDTMMLDSEEKTLNLLWRASVPWDFDRTPPVQFWLEQA